MIETYIKSIATRYKTGISREHSYRGDLQHLLQELNPGILVTNEPARIACGAPDYILTRNNIPVGYIEAKDIGVSLSKTDSSEQLKRYKASLDNLILTDYCDFWFYRDGKKVDSLAIAEIRNGKLVSTPDTHKRFTHRIHDFCLHVGQTITSAQKLAEMMAGKAKMMQAVIESALNSDEEHEQNSTLQAQMKAFKKILIHDIISAEFADIYAQTLAYGMFAARLHDPTLDTFTRQEAAELIPKTNPFLRKLFNYIAGIDIDTRLVWIVDALADIFRATDVAAILQHFGKATHTRDPMIHFYETFLAAYNPKLRKSRGVWYTPEPVVNFIVRAVDDLLKTEFGLSQGLADTSTTTIEIDTQEEDLRTTTKRKRAKIEVHTVQILDPAAGTGTFLAEVVKHIHQKFEGQQGIWSQYVEKHLIPRLHGFEILMASYAMAHLKLELLLHETGYEPETQQRLRVFLTNSLEEAHPDTGTFWANWLSSEATEANYIKRETPVMVVLGNPPYSVSSSNKGRWIQNLITDYKEGLNEKKLNLDDDYIKFIRYGEHFIEKNKEGILAYISNNSFLDGITQRQMRKHLLAVFDKIYILNLHGDTKKKEVATDRSKDENVFDIMQGVSINIFIKNGTAKNNQLASIFHYDLLGKRAKKYATLLENSMKTIEWQELTPEAPYFFFEAKNFDALAKYEQFISLSSLFKDFNCGIQTKNDKIAIQYRKDVLTQIIEDLKEKSVSEFKEKYHVKDGVWKTEKAKQDILQSEYKIRKILYRPFDYRFTALTKKSGGFLGRPRYSTMKHFLTDDNIGLIVNRQSIGENFSYIGVSKTITCHGTFYLGNRGQDYLLPLYLYSDATGQQLIDGLQDRKPNLDVEFLKQCSTIIGLTFVSEKKNSQNTFAPIDLLDYIYAVLHSPSYRETYKEFLKIDFPRIPYPKDQETFWQLVALGGELRQIHLLESPNVEHYITTYPQTGDNTVTRKIAKKDYELHEEQQVGRVWINDQQYFDNVPQVAWEFYIGGYQPAQKWLKDRRGRQLSFEDILHYQKIIVALTETDRIMQEIDKIDFME